MLPPFTRVLLSPLQIDVPSAEMDQFAAGIVEDLALLMNRLGEVVTTALSVEVIQGAHRAGRAVRPTGTPPAAMSPFLVPPLDAAAVDRLLSAYDGDAIVTGSIESAGDGLDISLTLRGDGGERRWASRLAVEDGEVNDARVILAANLVEAATGRRKDVRHVRSGGPTLVASWRRSCLARHRRVDAVRRIELLREAIHLDPDYAEAWSQLADAVERVGDRRAALEILQQAAGRFPQNSSIRQRYGVALSLAGQHKDAVAEVQAALDADPDGTVLFHAGLFAEAGGDGETAAVLYERAVERGCVQATLYQKLGGLRANAGRHEEAIELWDRARQLDTSMGFLLASIGLALHHLGRDAEAGPLFEQALVEAAHAFSTHANHAVYLQDLGRHADAVAACDRALQLRPDAASVLNHRGISRMMVGDLDGARADFEAALQVLPTGELATYVRANLARLEQGELRRTEAVRLLKEGAALVQREQGERAVPLLLESLDLVPELPESWIFLALAYRDGRMWDGVADSFAHALRLRPGDAEVLSERALALLALERTGEALEHARLAAQLAPEDAAIHCNLGLVQMEAGDLDGARDSIARAATLDPADPIVIRCKKELKKRGRKSADWGGSWQM